MQPCLTLLLGPSGVGKSAIKGSLFQLDSRFVYPSPYITRPLRDGEIDKITVSDSEFDDMVKLDMFIFVNRLYGVRYGTPKDAIRVSLRSGLLPVLDWPFEQLEAMRCEFGKAMLTVYVRPPSLEELNYRLSCDGRDVDGLRYAAAVKELESVDLSILDYSVISETDNVDGVAQEVYSYVLARVFR